MKLDFDKAWLQLNATMVLNPRMYDNLLVCFVNGEAILMEDQETLDTYIKYCRRGKSWWGLTAEKLNEHGIYI